MAIVTVRLDEQLKKKMEMFRDVNWSEVVRRAILDRISQEEVLHAHRRVNFELLRSAIRDQDRLRKKTSGSWSGAEEVRHWREFRK